MKPFLAIISPVGGVSGAHPDHELPQPQPPTGAPPAPDHTLPGDLPRPEHPIYYPLPPGAPVDPDYGVPIEHPDQGLPTPSPGTPTHPIVLPPETEGGWGPIYIWGGGPGARPPIAAPEPPTSPDVKWEVKTAWTASTGWIVIAVPTGAHPAPSKRR